MDDAPASEEAEDPPPPSVVRLLRDSRYEVLPLLESDKGLGKLDDGLAALAADTPIAVTCSPRRGLDATLRTAETLRNRGYPVCPHIAARQVRDKRHLREIVARLKALQISNIFVPGGDIPTPVGPYTSAVELLQALSPLDHGLAEIGVAAYPEGHPLIDDDTLAEALLAKRSLATYAVTQLCFSPETLIRWLTGIRDQGVDLPVLIGIPGVLRPEKLLRIALRVGVGESLSFLRKQQRFFSQLVGRRAYSPTSLVSTLADDLAADGRVRGFHIYSFNQLEGTERWRQELLTATGAAHR